MANYRFLLESEKCLQVVNVDRSSSIEQAIRMMREHFDFAQWRIVNIAEKAQEG